MFSVGSAICTQKRHRLKAETVERLAIIKINRLKLKEYEEKYGIPKPLIEAKPSFTDFDIEEGMATIMSTEDEIDNDGIIDYLGVDYVDDEDVDKFEDISVVD